MEGEDELITSGSAGTEGVNGCRGNPTTEWVRMNENEPFFFMATPNVETSLDAF